MKLIRLDVNAFKGISPDSPIVADFTKSRFVKVVGDNAVFKTSMLEALLVACGHLSKDDKNFVNLKTGKIDIDLDFKGNDGRNYHVRVTKSQFILTYEGEEQKEPTTKLKELLGIPAVSPMAIKNANIDTIVKWLASYTKKGAEEYDKEYRRLKEGVKRWKEARAEANKKYKGIKETIGDYITEQSWVNNEAKYSKDVDIKELSAKLDVAGKRSDKLIEAETKLKALKTRREQLMAELIEVEDSIQKGEAYVETNKTAKTDYDNVKQQYESAAELSAKYQWWHNIKRQKTEMDEYETLAQAADAKEKEMLDEIKTMQAELIPDVRGVELLIEDEIKDGKVIRPAGLYKGEINTPKMSETEFTKVIFSIIKKNKVPVFVIDNYQSLGSDGVKILEQAVKEGAYVFAAEMDRTKKTLEVVY